MRWKTYYLERKSEISNNRRGTIAARIKESEVSNAMPGIVGLEENEPRLQFSLGPFHSGPAAALIPHRRSFSYYRLPVHLLNLNVLKLDGTSFDVQVPRTASVRELKMAVEEVFYQSQDGIKERISWTHVWGQFCLSYRGIMLIDEKVLLKNFGVKDGDELHFTRHYSVSCTPTKYQPRSHAIHTEWQRKSWSGAELVEFEFEESVTEKRRNKELIPVINEDICQSPDKEETISCGEEDRLILKNNSYSKLSRYFKGWFCYSNPIYIMRASSAYRGC